MLIFKNKTDIFKKKKKGEFDSDATTKGHDGRTKHNPEIYL